MANENKILFYSEELNEDIYQNTKLLDSKKIILENNKKQQISTNSFNTIVDSKDYLGCINNNCSAIKCDCTNDKCICSNVKNNSNIFTSNSNSNSNNKPNTKDNINNYITKLIDFLFVLLLVGLLIFIIYKRESLYLVYVLGITLLYIFIKYIML